jgi:hypothetical protein
MPPPRVEAAAAGGGRFILLFVAPGDDVRKCRVADAVALPPPATREAFLSCQVPDGQQATPDSIGVGLRQLGAKTQTYYWETDLTAGKLVRQPLAVLGWDHSLRCTYPETGA